MPIQRKLWLGEPPKECDIDGRAIIDVFYDARTKQGPWANVCPKCFLNHCVGVGTGYGQRYQLRDDGKWEKTHG